MKGSYIKARQRRHWCKKCGHVFIEKNMLDMEFASGRIKWICIPCFRLNKYHPYHPRYSGNLEKIFDV